MIAAAVENSKQTGRVLWQEAKELHLIFAAIWRKKNGHLTIKPIYRYI
jgi:hypothetical protein